MRKLTRFVVVLVFCAFAPALLAVAEHYPVWRVYPPGEHPSDARLTTVRTLNDAYHPWHPSESLPEWEKESQAIRERVLVSNGLWPAPPKTPLAPTIHGKVDRGDYTVEKVLLASLPGHYVTGNLYRPAMTEGGVPGVLCPHGHWQDGRFHDAGEKEADAQINAGAETFMAAARHPLQARMVQLARLGCVVFHYDMVGYADSQQIGHRNGFTDVEAGLWLQSFMGLQTWNSIRALDFLLSLPEVDPNRVGVTGASGGGTQTFMLCAVDARPTVAFPAVMVSTGMQGGCVCENADYLRIGINNIALAATFAPKPLAMSGADDWTVEIEEKGLPELRQVYGLLNRPELVHAEAFAQFKHNYNQVARQMMYRWFNKHLNLELDEPIVERDFEPLSRQQLSVFDEDHSRPSDAGTVDDLRKYLTQVAGEQFKTLIPKTAKDAARYRQVIGTAARVMLEPVAPDQIVLRQQTKVQLDTVSVEKGIISREGSDSGIPIIQLLPSNYGGTVVVWIDGAGKSHLFDDRGQPNPHVARLLEKGIGVVSADPMLTGELVEAGEQPQYIEVNKGYHGYTFGYNRPLLAERVRDILAVLRYAGSQNPKKFHLVGTSDAGPWVLLARAMTEQPTDQTVVDVRGFDFDKVKSTADSTFLPGALKYGGIGGLAALAAPAKLVLAGAHGLSAHGTEALTAMYSVTGGDLTLAEDGLTHEAMIEMLLK